MSIALLVRLLLFRDDGDEILLTRSKRPQLHWLMHGPCEAGFELN
jgi:hypothetical protein